MHTCTSAGQRGQIQRESAFNDPGIGTDPVPLGDDEDVAGHKVLGRDVTPHVVAHDVGRGRQERSQCLHGLLGLHLLGDGESGVQKNHCHNSDRERRCSSGPGQNGGQGQRDRERLSEVGACPRIGP